MKVAIVGSRGVTDMAMLHAAVTEAEFPITHIVSGGALGVDTLAQALAKELCIPITIYYADWEAHGKAAGPIRNQLIVNEAVAMIAIRSRFSRGTTDAIKKAKAKGISVYIKDLP